MSTSSDPAGTSRPSTSEGQQPGPIPLFDHHLRVLTDSYLQFFQERKRIEEVYCDSLLKLHKKAKTIDTYLDGRGESSTARSAWSEVRDNVEREAQTRQAFLTTLTVDVLNPLSALKETQDRTRKRIKEDIKDSTNAHTDYAENTVPKLKRTYLRKCQEVEDLKLAAAAPSQPLTSQSDSSTIKSPTSPKPTVTSPHPLRPLDRRPSGGAPGGPRNRSPSGSTALQDLAHQGKKQLNQLMTFLEKRDTVKDGLGGRSSDASLRIVRAKREADEADKEYRKAVHWLETLRIRRMKILEAGYKSLEMFLHESADTLKKVLCRYTDNMIATTMTQTQLSSHARSLVDKISPEMDVSVVSSKISRSLASATPPPVRYYNYEVGECNDLIFGVSLVDYATARGLGEGEIPKIVKMCIEEVDKRGLEVEGIYRVSGRHAVVQALQHKLERNEQTFKFNPNVDDVYVVSSLLKLYLRELPEPVFRFPLTERIQHSEDLHEHKSNNFALLRSKMRRLPAVHQATLRAIVEHLSRVASFSEKNKMDAKNLAIVFGGVIFGEDDMPKGGDLLNMQNFRDSLMEDLILNAPVLFDDRPSNGETPLPAAPAGEAPVQFPLGSSHTKVASVPNVPVPPTSSLRPPDDFIPALPARPANSIHPSSRANHISNHRQDGDSKQAGRPKYQAAEAPEAWRAPEEILDDEFESRGRKRSIARKRTSAPPSMRRPSKPEQ
ncbi:RhoGAP-domain-containing protein [Gloeophyllum trabeum ATCC 11539]|uniref:RhoGAP-domain-containing protein n=1 Tax=Gloeophyllum trabeum (strain ATCC 11539 / FP-39264 / Madison 617) TaxID=670483 RepID=S7QNK7_GLOTA|nr:RhoGAP-domain-containing protein [Gloeophyllum trabeum ATCC 11539]EPQ61103.1 RhoGAP-domain-containing protein [Gloeophyllum trabeum ATCC 11539]